MRIIGFLLMFAGIGSFIFLLVRPVNGVSCQDDQGNECSELINSQARSYSQVRPYALLIGGNTFSDLNRFAKDVRVSIDTRLRLNFRLRGIIKPQVVVTAEGESGSIFSEDATFITTGDMPELPRLQVKSKVSPDELTFATKLFSQLGRTLSYKEGVIENGALNVQFKEYKIYYPLSGDVDALIGATLVAFSQLNGSGEKSIMKDRSTPIKELDFRYKNPILR